ncbi:MAG: hypothetical protein WCX12_00740 [Candidatus Paceibacterota bacterium]|jgi:hypothetical protein
MPNNFFPALLLTIAVEVLIAVILGFRNKNSIVSVVCVNLITNPILNYFLWINNAYSFIRVNITIVLFFEILIVFIELLLLTFALRQNVKKMLVLSIVMNLFSYIVGVLIFR